MQGSFFKKSSDSDTSDTEDSIYEFIPVKNDETDEETKSLFEQLEEGATRYTNIYDTVQRGANLFAKKTDGDFEDCYPIHVAAYMVDYNIEAVSSLLQTFDDPEKRKEYILLKDDEGLNALEILIIKAAKSFDIPLPGIISILSFLTVDEQQQIMDSLCEKAKKKLTKDELSVSRQEDIHLLAELNDYFFIQNRPIEMNRQRRKEEAKVLTDYDSDEESLGQLKCVENKKFTARVTYKDTKKDGVLVSIPELMLIPSDWRLETAIEGNQGDHVTAYVLLLSSFSHCQGENIKKLPELVCNLAIDILPDHQELFLKELQKNDNALNEYSDIRKKTIASLKAHCDAGEINLINAAENNLRKAEVELIARHIEDNIDQFITIINKLQDESFSQERKKSLTGNYILQQLIRVLENVSLLKEKRYSIFNKIIVNVIQMEAEKDIYQNNYGLTDKALNDIVITIMKKDLKKVRIPKQLLSKSGKLIKNELLAFLKAFTPFKKYHEGRVIKSIKDEIMALQKISYQNKRNESLYRIGYLCFKLFDYPKVNDAKLNDERVLYQAIPRHLIIIQAAFSYLKKLPYAEQEQIYNAFLTKILVLQLWDSQQVLNEEGQSVFLNLDLLKVKILEFANLDKDHHFSMKSRLPTSISSLSPKN